eukprot:scaffold3403_cov300-Pinguiococcus_pyrenoidosus.AAC.4
MCWRHSAENTQVMRKASCRPFLLVQPYRRTRFAPCGVSAHVVGRPQPHTGFTPAEMHHTCFLGDVDTAEAPRAR